MSLSSYHWMMDGVSERGLGIGEKKGYREGGRRERLGGRRE